MVIILFKLFGRNALCSSPLQEAVDALIENGKATQLNNGFK
jgi:hypothetical protein